MNNINIDTEKLNEQILAIKEVVKDLSDIFMRIKDDTNNLKDDWDSKTSKNVYNSFDKLYLSFEEVENTFHNDIDFLERVVDPSYTLEDSNTSKLIDDYLVVGKE
jgi:hypothetical protein